MCFITKQFDALTKEELYSILKLRMEIFILEQRSFYLDLDGEDQQAMHVLGVEENDKTLLCYGRVTIENSTAHLRRICVRKDYRQAGLGSLLMTKLLSYVDSLNTDMIELDAQIHLQNFYAKFGFHATGLPYDDGGVMHIKMEKAG